MLKRRAFLLGASLGLAGCAAPDTVQRQGPAPVGAGLLTPWMSLTGGWRTDAQLPLQGTRPILGRATFVQPTGVAVRGDVVVVADGGSRTLWRLDRARDSIAPLAPFNGGVAEAGTSLYIGSDFATFVALPAEHVVVQYDLRGREVRRWGDRFDAPRPVAIAIPEDRSEILVGDGATARVVVFDPLGHIRRVLGGRSPVNLQSLTAMALGPRGLYVLDRIGQQVVVLNPAGLPVEVIGEQQLVQPRALAVDASGRVFVSDDAGQRIKVFRGDKLLAEIGGPGLAPGVFGRIESLAVEGNLLYVADSVSARVQVFMVAPPSLEPGGGK